MARFDASESAVALLDSQPGDLRLLVSIGEEPMDAPQPSDSPGEPNTVRPEIRVTNRQLWEIIYDAWDAIGEQNRKTPSLFIRNGSLVRIEKRKGEHGSTHLVVIPETVNSVYGRLIRVADWYRWEGRSWFATKPPREIAHDFLETPRPTLPRLEALVSAPMLARDGSLIQRPGYNAETATHLDPAGLTEPVVVPERPSAAEVADSVAFIRDELLTGFDFVGPSDFAHSVGALLQPSVRPLIDGPTPMHGIEAPTPGSGKNLLATVMSIIATGEETPAQALPNDDEETRRTLTALLSAAHPIILLDNLDSTGRRGHIHRSSLAAALTANEWKDRIVRTSQSPRLPIRALWMSTANNPKFSMELARRTVRIRLDPKMEQPWRRTGFRHPDLRSWAKTNRPELIRSLLILARSWIAGGRPSGRRTLGSYESWSAVIGGILEHAGIPGFLDNLDDHYAAADAEGQMWREFCLAWWDEFGGGDVRPSDLNRLCNEQGLMTSVRGSGSPRSQETRLGNALPDVRGRIFAGFLIELVKDKGKKGRWYALRLAPDGDASAESPRDDKSGDQT